VQFQFVYKQKLNYIHLNPCQWKWNLSNTPEDYEHSSAKFYICGEQGGYPVTNYLALDDVDITKLLNTPMKLQTNLMRAAESSFRLQTSAIETLAVRSVIYCLCCP